MSISGLTSVLMVLLGIVIVVGIIVLVVTLIRVLRSGNGKRPRGPMGF